MKTMKNFFMLMAALMISFAATSCGTEDYDDDDDLDDEDLAALVWTGKQTATLNESADQLVLTIKHENVQTMTYSAKFTNGVCTNFIMKVECFYKALADKYEEVAKRNGAEYSPSRSGNTITMDMSSLYKRAPYEEVKEQFDGMKAAVDSGELWHAF